MEKAAEVLVPPQPDKAPPLLDPQRPEGEAAEAAAACASSFDPMEEFRRRLEDIIRAHGPAASRPDKQSVMDAEMEKKEEVKRDNTVATDTDVSLVMQSLNKFPSPQEKLEGLVRKYADLAVLRRCDEQKFDALQQKMCVLLEERQQLHTERRNATTARSKLEALCRDLQAHYNVLREETLQRCREDEEKRTEITTHFQSMLTEIQTQIEHHSARNDKLCCENTNLTEKLESLMTQCERREESLEKINKHRDLQHQLTEAKLQQANALLAEAEERHKREKEYLLVQAAEWKLQAQTLREQATVMQAQLTLYAQKFDEFQATLAKSNEIYVRFKNEMDNMSEKMKKMEKESNMWKTRFENCNKALTDMMEERIERGKEYDLFVLKIQKLEKLCRVLQDERKILYEKIKDVRRSNSEIPTKHLGSSNNNPESTDPSALLSIEEVQEIQEEDPVLTEDMARLREEQAKLQEFAESLLATPEDKEEEETNETDLEEDEMASAFTHFKSKTKEEKAVSDTPEPVKVEEAPTPEKMTSETTEATEEVEPEEEIQPQEAKAEPTTDPEPARVEILEEPIEVTPAALPEEAPKPSEPSEPSEPSDPVPPSESTPTTAESSKKQALKKKKKRNAKSAS
ncbi:beta-taxilin isoform X2 [Parambassis ranga]|uniref:Beta-taxilin isoform X2 n=1 Tax=Parambassis ranga TaxID=210632 RepID=A0A6P7HL02_9TELE|nr:beta-taxilin isoform X2 [Parambassis ranga]